MNNDMIIIGSIALLFIMVGAILPLMVEDSDIVVKKNITAIEDDLIQNAENIGSDVSAWKVFKTVSTMFFWEFSYLGFWLNAVLFLPLRIVFWLTIARNIWIGGGG